MRRLAQAPTIAIAELWADTLRQAGFSASVQRYFLRGIAGELPPGQCLPKVWLTNDQEEPRAKAMLEGLQNLPHRRWVCACGELVEGGFEECWQCGLPMQV